MMTSARNQQLQQLPLGIVGSNVFGRYDKISVEQTINMIISDNTLVDFAGYKNVKQLLSNQTGRGLYGSSRGNLMLAVVGSFVIKIDTSLNTTIVGQINTSVGDVFITENNNGEIAISDYQQIYVYNWAATPSPTFKKSPIDFTIGFNPGFLSFQDGRMLSPGIGNYFWYLSAFNNAISWSTSNANQVGQLLTKPDTTQACVPFPGRSNLLFVFGRNVTEVWTDIGAALFPYQKNTSFNIDYGCINPSTIAFNENVIVWLAGNEKSGPAIMYSTGGAVQKISTDGIDFRLSTLTAPQDSYGFLFRQDGHVLYMLTFTTDNVSYLYDFNTGKFFTATDENLNHHIARKIIFFNNKYYFVSFNDGNLYEISTQYTNYQYSNTNIKEIPRIRFTPPLKFPDQRWRICSSVGFTIENGRPNTIDNTNQYVPLSNMCIDLRMSRDGGETFGNAWRQNMNASGVRKSRMIYHRLGIVNDASFQFEFVGLDRFVIGEGIVEVYA